MPEESSLVRRIDSALIHWFQRRAHALQLRSGRTNYWFANNLLVFAYGSLFASEIHDTVVVGQPPLISTVVILGFSLLVWNLYANNVMSERNEAVRRSRIQFEQSARLTYLRARVIAFGACVVLLQCAALARGDADRASVYIVIVIFSVVSAFYFQACEPLAAPLWDDQDGCE